MGKFLIFFTFDFRLNLKVFCKIQPILAGEKLISQCKKHGVKYMIKLKPGIFHKDGEDWICLKSVWNNREVAMPLLDLQVQLKQESGH